MSGAYEITSSAPLTPLITMCIRAWEGGIISHTKQTMKSEVIAAHSILLHPPCSLCIKSAQATLESGIKWYNHDVDTGHVDVVPKVICVSLNMSNLCITHRSV